MKLASTPFFRGSIAALIFVTGYNVDKVLRFAGLRNFLEPTDFTFLVSLLQVIICLLGVWLVYQNGLKNAFMELGLFSPVSRALVFAVIATVPMFVAFGLTSGISGELTLRSVLAFSVVSPFAEEVLFRGYLFRQLYRRLKTGFWVAALFPSMLFGLGHMYQSNGTWDFVGITAITGIGSLLFCWIFMRWQDNLWVPFGLHFLMNLGWDVFAVDDTALGGWLANGARLLTVLAAIVLTLNKDRIWRRLSLEDENISEFEEKDLVKNDVQQNVKNALLPI